MQSIENLYKVVQQRKAEPQENSYTCYLFTEGLDKILKKVGEESAETIIAAKNSDPIELQEEVCDLLYHLVVLLVEQGVALSDVDAVLAERSAKIGNLKSFHQVDRNS